MLTPAVWPSDSIRVCVPACVLYKSMVKLPVESELWQLILLTVSVRWEEIHICFPPPSPLLNLAVHPFTFKIKCAAHYEHRLRLGGEEGTPRLTTWWEWTQRIRWPRNWLGIVHPFWLFLFCLVWLILIIDPKLQGIFNSKSKHRIVILSYSWSYNAIIKKKNNNEPISVVGWHLVLT